MTTRRITIDQFYTYDVTDVRSGGMGYVLLLSLIDRAHKAELTERIVQGSPDLADRFRYPYRATLAAKTVQEPESMPIFARECNIWLEFEHPGVVPLLKVVDVEGMTLALMPQFSGSLRDLIIRRQFSRTDLLKSLCEPVAGLADIYQRHGVVHQDIKPENLLYHQRDSGQLRLLLSDWGIANVQASRLPPPTVEWSRFALSTMTGFGTLPYMAPERFYNYVSDRRADVFSLGMLIIEIIAGGLPYDGAHPIEQQIISGDYYEKAEGLLSSLPGRMYRAILKMIHPDARMRENE